MEYIVTIKFQNHERKKINPKKFLAVKVISPLEKEKIRGGMYDDSIMVERIERERERVIRD